MWPSPYIIPRGVHYVTRDVYFISRDVNYVTRGAYFIPRGVYDASVLLVSLYRQC